MQLAKFVIAGWLIMGCCGSATGEIILQHSFQNVYQAGAEDYLYSTSFLRKYSEWQNPPVTYWGTTANNQDAEIV